MEQHIIIQCASCGQRMRVPAGAKGKVYKCVKCGARVSAAHHTPPSANRETLVGQPQAPAAQTMAEHFVKMGLVSREQMEEAQTKQLPTEKFFETLLRLEMISKNELHARLSKEPGAAAINLANFSIESDLTKLVPLEIARQHWVLPISSMGKSLTVAMVCPVDMEALVAVEKVTEGRRIRSMLCTIDDFTSAVRKHYRVPDSQDVSEESAEDTGAATAGAAPATAAAAPATTAAAATSSVVYPGGETISKALKELPRLPIPSRVMNMVDAVVGVGSEEIRQVVSVVANSPVLTANILATANSAAYGLPKNVDSIPMAITLIGEQAVSLLATNAPKLPMASEKLWSPLTHFSRHCAEIAAILAVDCGRVTANVAYCAGLLHALGSYAMGAIEPEEYEKIDPELFGEKRIHLEKQVFGMGYNEAGSLICEQWNIPEVLQAALYYSIAPDDAGDFRDIAAIVYVASHLASVEGEVDLDGIAKYEDILKSLSINPSEIAASLGKSATEAANANQ